MSSKEITAIYEELKFACLLNLSIYIYISGKHWIKIFTYKNSEYKTNTDKIYLDTATVQCST